MTKKSRYALDAGVFIEAKKRYYAFDIAPGYWDALLRLQKAGDILSIDRVKQEIEKQQDDLQKWIGKHMPHACFASTKDDGVIGRYGEAQKWVSDQGFYKEKAVAEFAADDNADGWLHAYARHNDLVLVTEEHPDTAMRRKVNLPHLCGALGVRAVNTFQMLRELGVKLN